MIHALALLITTASIAGLGVIIEGATGASRFLKVWADTRLRPQAPPHANTEPDDEAREDECN